MFPILTGSSISVFTFNFVSFFLIACHCKTEENIWNCFVVFFGFFFKENLNQASVNIGSNIQSTVQLRKQVRIILLSWQLERMTNAYRYLKSQSILNTSHFFSLHYITYLFTLQALWGLDFVPFLCFYNVQHNGAQNLIEAFCLSCSINVYEQQQSFTLLVGCRVTLYICYFPGALLIIVPKGWCPMLEQLERHKMRMKAAD